MPRRFGWKERATDRVIDRYLSQFHGSNSIECTEGLVARVMVELRKGYLKRTLVGGLGALALTGGAMLAEKHGMNGVMEWAHIIRAVSLAYTGCTLINWLDLETKRKATYDNVKPLVQEYLTERLTNPKVN